MNGEIPALETQAKRNHVKATEFHAPTRRVLQSGDHVIVEPASKAIGGRVPSACQYQREKHSPRDEKNPSPTTAGFYGRLAHGFASPSFTLTWILACARRVCSHVAVKSVNFCCVKISRICGVTSSNRAGLARLSRMAGS